MIFFGLLFLAVGLGNIGQDIPQQTLTATKVISSILPLYAWFILWTMSGALLVLGAFYRRVEVAAFAFGSFMSTIFSLGYFAAFILGYNNRAWLTAVLYGAIAIVQQVVAGWPDASRNLQ